MNKQEVIKYLEKKREAALENIEYYHGNEKYRTMNRVRLDSYTIAIRAVEKMEEPEKVEVTEKQAELLRAFRDESLYELLANCLGEDEELMAKARLFGYTVKLKRWVVKYESSGNSYYFSKWYQNNGNPFEPNGLEEKHHSMVANFTDRAKAEAVATLVEGTVEEV